MSDAVVKEDARKMLRTEGAASYVGLSISTLEKLRLTGYGPAYIKLGRAVVYRAHDLDAWIESNRRKSTSVAA
ncbi:helix-turn-helix domain-containing protein [Mesorhizobium sp. AR02]|uniref:helix-turn-helix transcriptional regulator n=1 Tax=Mesorhizobium sp. AR02 TaxID=2865837 RepID=UPI00215E71A5|nr:helix-turn-helix domain-containing protein [Mesorhizobium sp. AR02]UVK55107.1 helix-turn-helix domain-containing protein [Mesorhizobium sp. AR02]